MTAQTEPDLTFRQLADAVPQFVWWATPTGRVRYFNTAWVTYTGVDADATDDWQTRVHPDDIGRAASERVRAIVEKCPYEVECRIRAQNGSYRWFVCRAAPVRENGADAYWFGSATDVDDVHRSRGALDMYARVGIALQRALGTDAPLAAVAQAVVPAFGDWCAIDLLDDAGRLRRAAIVHRDPTRIALARALAERYPDREDSPYGAAAVARTGEPLLLAEISDEMLAAGAHSPEHLALIRSLGLCSAVLAPIRETGELRAAAGELATDRTSRVVGVITCVLAETGRRYDAHDLEVVEGLAQRVGLAMERGELYAEAHRRERELLEHNESLQQQAVELEMQSAQLQEQAAELEAQTDELTIATDELARINDVQATAEERLRLATDAGGLGTWDFDPVGGRLTWDARCRAAFGLPPDAHVDYDVFLKWLHADDRARADAAVRSALDPAGPGAYDIEYRTKGPDGVVRWIRATGRSFFTDVLSSDDTPPVRTATRFIGTVLDVSADRRQEEALREEAQIVETLQRVGSAVAAKLDLEELVQSVTDETTRITGAQFGAFFYNVLDDRGESYMLYSISGVPREAFSKFPMPRNTAVFAPTFNGEGAMRSDDITKDHRYGHNTPRKGMPEGHLPVRSYLAVPVVSRSGEVLGGLFYGHATPGVFTERHERLALGIAAWAAVGIDNARLYESERKARAEAEDANLAKSQFLATMSHELRTPLNAIGGYADLLLYGVRGPLADAQRDDVERIKRSGQHLLSLINDILNFAKLEAGQIHYQRRPFAVSRVLADLESLVAPQVGARALRYSTEPAPDTLAIFGDAEKTQQILINLVTNAVKFTEPGGSIRVRPEADGDSVRIHVEDTGRGIPLDQQVRIFDPFVQLDRHLTPASLQGVGLGLAISRDLARGMGGDLTLSSREGDGSVFTITLPRAETSPRA